MENNRIGGGRREAPSAPLKGELAARTGCLRGFLVLLCWQTNPSGFAIAQPTF